MASDNADVVANALSGGAGARAHRAVLCVDTSRVFIVETPEAWQRCLTHILHGVSVVKVLGMDTEWVTRDGRMQPVSMLQLATLTGVCVLVRLHLMREYPQSLRDLLEDKSVLKAGVAVCNDASKLLQGHGLQVNGCVDLVNLVTRARLPFSEERGARSLQGVALRTLGVALDKDPHIRRSNWERSSLSVKQIDYAAKDALVGAFAFWRIVSLKLHCAQFFCDRTAGNWHKAQSCCQGLVDVPYKHTTTTSKPKATRNSKSVEKNTAKLSSSTRAYVARKSPLYHHCALIAPDGQLLCTCDTKKAQWYIDKGLGVKVSDEPLKVQLTFEPSGRPIDEQNYYTQDKLNVCVVCGASGTYIRKSIIPHEYRKYFPQVMKEHRSHDVLLMCLECHQKSNLYDAALKERLAHECNAPLDAGEYGKYKRDHVIHRVKSAAKALSSSERAIPEPRKQELTQLIKDYFGADCVDGDLLMKAVDLDPKMLKEDFFPHGRLVVHHHMRTRGLIDFEKLWRQHFVDSLAPRHLPAMWSVDHHHQQLSHMGETIQQTAGRPHSTLKMLKS